MITLPALLSRLMVEIQAYPLYQTVNAVETQEFAPDQYVLKIRVTLQDGYQLQIRIYMNRKHVDYAYQLFRETPLLRWDNKEEYRSIATYPHHHHTEHGFVQDSSLTSDPLSDLPIVLSQVAAFVARESAS